MEGSYGYQDNQGLYRQVDYVANAGGFRASLKTNEPGVIGHTKENPADVFIQAEQPPAGLQEKYSQGGQGGHGGWSYGEL